MIEIFHWASTSHFVKRCAALNLHFTKIIDRVFASKKLDQSQEKMESADSLLQLGVRPRILRARPCR